MIQADRDVTKDPMYPFGFFATIVGFILALLFAFFTYEMTTECWEICTLNQTYVDDLKDLRGKPMCDAKAHRHWLGEDKMFWLLPTRPVQTMNFCEKLWSMQQLKQVKSIKELVEGEYDPKGVGKAEAWEKS